MTVVFVSRETVSSAMMFGSILFATVCLGVRKLGEESFWSAVRSPRAKALNIRSYESVMCCLYHFSIFGLILLGAYLCEHNPPFPHSPKSYDRDEFFFLTAMLFLAAFYTIDKNDKHTPTSTSTNSTATEKKSAREVSPANDVLNRNQTEEWKGWMQFMFLLYHYYHAEEVYNSIRIMITCYVWMTGFGNFSFFYLKGDYSFVRVIQMLWRLNFLVIFLCLTQGTTYILYYICPLHTFFFGLVYITMRVYKHVNYSRNGIRIKLIIVASLIYLIWDSNIGIFDKLFFFLPTQSILGAKGGTLWEWYFRSSLDHWSTFLGMLFALNYPITSLFIRKLEAQSFVREWTAKILIAIPLLAAFYVWVTSVLNQPKLEYNQTNAYFGFIPLITYIYLRNISHTLRCYSLNLLHEIGKTTLETYLMQHHIWLTSNAKTLLTIIPGWPKLNMLVVTFCYFYTSRKLYKLTLYLRGMLLPDNTRFCLYSMVGLISTVASFYILALLLEQMGEPSLIVIFIVSLVCGSFLYKVLLHITNTPTTNITSTTDSMKTISNSSSDNCITKMSKVSPMIVGTIGLLMVGGVWTSCGYFGANQQPSQLEYKCSPYVNDGMWIPIQDFCNEESRGRIHRDYDIAGVATCESQNMVWGWKDNNASGCQFTQRSSSQLKSKLDRKTIVFAGDDSIQSLYYALLRTMGQTGTTATTTEVEGMQLQVIGDTSLVYVYAPTVNDHLSVFQTLVPTMQEQFQKNKVDLLVMGVGLTDDEGLLKELAKQTSLWRSNSPIVWMTPTRSTLDDDLKEDYLKSLYQASGVLSSASFVLEGQVIAQSTDSPVVYDAGIQIFANALDWLVPVSSGGKSKSPPKTGSMSHPGLGLAMIGVISIGLLFQDSYFGCSYLASLVIPGVKPAQLYDEAFSKLHSNIKHVELTEKPLITKQREDEHLIIVDEGHKTGSIDAAVLA